MNRSLLLDRAVEFVLKRAFRAGAVTRANLLDAFDVSSATATRLMSEALARHPRLLERQGQRILPRPLAEAPPCATEAALLATLDEGGNDFLARVGLYAYELPVVYVTWANSLPRKPGILTALIEAVRNEGFLRIVYLPMRKNAEPAWRTIAPLGLERMNDQWRVVAQDMEKEGFPIRVFVLTRILDAQREVYKRLPKGFVRQHVADAEASLPVELNAGLTPLQKEVVSAELGIRDGKVRVARRGIFEFQRRFSRRAPTPDAVWPPLDECGDESGAT